MGGTVWARYMIFLSHVKEKEKKAIRENTCGQVNFVEFLIYQSTSQAADSVGLSYKYI